MAGLIPGDYDCVNGQGRKDNRVLTSHSNPERWDLCPHAPHTAVCFIDLRSAGSYPSIIKVVGSYPSIIELKALGSHPSIINVKVVGSYPSIIKVVGLDSYI